MKKVEKMPMSIAVENPNGEVEVVFTDEKLIKSTMYSTLMKLSDIFLHENNKKIYNGSAQYGFDLASGRLAETNFIKTKDDVWRVSCNLRLDEYTVMSYNLCPVDVFFKQPICQTLRGVK